MEDIQSSGDNFVENVFDVEHISKRILGCKYNGLVNYVLNHCFVGAYRDGKLRMRGVRAKVTGEELVFLVQQAKNIIREEPILLHLDAPICVIGDLHGQFTDLLRIFDQLGHPPEKHYLFLGDYVDRGSNSIETISLILAYKVLYPDKIHLLRGNHETPDISRIYGFYDECKRRFSPRVWRLFVDCFNYLPLAAVISKKIFCAHGGISPEIIDSMKKLTELERPLHVPDEGVVTDVLWSDPDPGILGWEENERGVSFTFGRDVLERFLKSHNFDLVCRGHQVVEDGYEFFANRRLVTVFSATNYCGEFDNDGGILNIDAELVCSFSILKPIYLPGEFGSI